MSRRVNMLFTRNGIFLPIPAEIDTMFEDENGFIVSINYVPYDWSSVRIVETEFYRYNAFVYDENGKPQITFMSNEYDEVLEYWEERFPESRTFVW